ncbi:hypothetical protein NUW54_g2127 [Trametes sanguinea]|uniref:Uncharacterized protein n=1 Tax=Trametes sanguinea TaxID=158606 RepID=A0ACC1Q730_9APHY|nr:hypothetical protein NUW54_g2127 [Trametes sanguinea]
MWDTATAERLFWPDRSQRSSGMKSDDVGLTIEAGGDGDGLEAGTLGSHDSLEAVKDTIADTIAMAAVAADSADANEKLMSIITRCKPRSADVALRYLTAELRRTILRLAAMRCVE